MPLTDTAIRNARSKDKPYKLTDADGMHLLVQPNGSKLWRLAYRFDGKQKTLALGSYRDVPLGKARELRDAARRQIAIGIDPMAAKQAEFRATRLAQGLTFRALAQEHHDIWKVGKNPAHVDRVWSRLERDAFPVIGNRPLTEITATEILDMIRRVEARGAIDISKRLKQKCSEVFAYAIASGRAMNDPTASVGKALMAKPRVEHMAMVSERELPALLRAIDGYRINKVVRMATQFALLTATRTNEVREATWAEFTDDIWRIPAARMKMKREHLVPLSRQARELLVEIKKESRGVHLFPGPRRPLMNTNAMINCLYDLGYRGRQTVHGFRRLFSTLLNEREFNSDWIETQLAHSDSDEIRGAYNAAQYLGARTHMMQFWADLLDEKRLAADDEYEALLG